MYVKISGDLADRLGSIAMRRLAVELQATVQIEGWAAYHCDERTFSPPPPPDDTSAEEIRRKFVALMAART